MRWIEQLHRTYQNSVKRIGDPNDDIPLLPICHTTQKAHIQIAIDTEGRFLRASVVLRNDARTIIPCTEESGGRTSGTTPHPLCDKLQYVASDYVEYGGDKDPCFEMYVALLGKWKETDKGNSKLGAVFNYVKRGRVVADLIEAKVLHVATPIATHVQSKLLNQWIVDNNPPEIFKLLPGGVDGKGKNKIWQADAFVRWQVEAPGDPQRNVWEDKALWKSWETYCHNLNPAKGLCYVTGNDSILATQHPAKLRNDGDKAKLISSNDTSGFTFRGRFRTSDEACGVAFDVTQKAHSALRWLIGRQGNRAKQSFVAWAVSGNDVPDPLADTLSLIAETEEASMHEATGYTAQEMGLALTRLAAGYSARLGSTDQVVVLGIDSASPGKGRMAVTFYRELTGSEFLQRVLAWHNECRWLQTFGADKVFVGAPSPHDIAESAYGRRFDDKLCKATIERLLPCIIDGASLPRDLVAACVRRASNRSGFKEKETWEWEKVLGIACALYNHSNKEGNYTMSLERERKTRDYLYGRLLAAADGLETWALRLAQEKRPTNAARMMQRFADHPCSTWRTIELALTPYKARLGGRAQKYLAAIDEAMAAFTADEFSADSPLTGEFLLGYHAQRAAFWVAPENDAGESDKANEEVSEKETTKQE